MTVVLAIDGGGTRTRLVAADGGGRLLGHAESTSINLADHAPEDAVRVLRAAVTHLREAADLGDAPIDDAFFAVGGVLTERDREAVRNVAAAAGVAPAGRTGIHHDAFAALEGGLLGKDGMIVVAGTGSICFGRAADGREAKCGNWGPLLGDEGSGHWLGREALRAVVHAHDGRGGSTSLASAALSYLGIERIDDMLRRVHADGFDRAAVARFAPIVLELAERGDAVAREILRRGCRELARCVAVVQDRLFAGAGSSLLATGGLGKNPTYIGEFVRQVRRLAPGASLEAPALPPVLGALRLSLVLAGNSASDEIDARLREASEELPASS